jgi:hypothetical protein
MRLVHGAIAILLVTSAVLLGGCGCSGRSKAAKGPETVLLRGKVVFTRGGKVKSLFDRQARIEFESVDRPGVRAVGPIEEDGSFVVATITSEGGSPGAVPGTHRVRLELEDNSQKLVAPQFLDFAKSGITIKLPSDQPIEINVWR